MREAKCNVHKILLIGKFPKFCNEKSEYSENFYEKEYSWNPLAKKFSNNSVKKKKKKINFVKKKNLPFCTKKKNKLELIPKILRKKSGKFQKLDEK